MIYSIQEFCILLALLTFNSALLYNQSISTTFEAFVIHCQQIIKNSELNTKVMKSGDYSEIIKLNDKNNCCSLEFPTVLMTTFNSCITQNDQQFYIQYPQIISSSNETLINQKCLKITFNLFCEIITNNESHKTNEILIQDINSCIQSFVKILESHKQYNEEQNGLILRTVKPSVSDSSENILMRSFESEKLELKCIIESFPEPDIQWLRNNQIINNINNDSNDFHINSDNFEIKNEFSVCKTTAILEFPVNNEYVFANYSCIAINSFGKTSKTFTIEENILLELKSKMKIKRFNITGFVIGMCPPMLISFYIIIKLGYRSRYAQERTDENGMNEEPFFVSN